MADSVSIVIPTLDRPDFLRSSIIGALGQTRACEVVVVDHGSGPATREAASEFGGRIRYVRRDVDSGPVFAWLDGVLHASGDFINLHFDDDLLEPEFVDRCLRLMGPTVGMVFSSATVFSRATGQEEVLFADWFPGTGAYSSRHAGRVMSRALVSPCAALHRRSVLLDALYIGRLPFQQASFRGVGPDFLVQQLALLRYSEVGFVREPLVRFRAHEGSITVGPGSREPRRFEAAYREVELYVIDLRVAELARRSGLTRFALGVRRRPRRLRTSLRSLFERCLRSLRRGDGS